MPDSRTHALGSAPSCADVERFLDVAAARLLPGDPVAYGRAALEACEALSAMTAEAGANDLSTQAALRALTHSDALPVELVVALLLAGGTDDPRVHGQAPAEWSDPRRVLARVWAMTVQRLAVRRLEPPPVPPSNLEPAGTGLPSGVDPSAIADIALRAAYERDIAAGAGAAERFDEWRQQSDLATTTQDAARGYLCAVYPGPAGRQLIREMLDREGVDSEVSALLLGEPSGG